MKKWLIALGIFFLAAGAAAYLAWPKIFYNAGPVSFSRPGRCTVAPGEWEPARGECPSNTAEMRFKCDQFCQAHPDCCGQRNENAGGAFGGREMSLPLPEEKTVRELKRVFPKTIKALNEGPNIYSREGKSEILSEEKLTAVKALGFNTIQVLLIGRQENGRLVFNGVNNSVLLNDIAAMKKHGLAAWVALDFAGPPSAKADLGNYDDLKASFSDFTKAAAELMEEYQVEYLTATNEVDKTFKEQKQWSSAQINDYLADFLPAVNAAAREKFSGRIINKITRTGKHAPAVLKASFKNVDIAGVDVGPPMDSSMNLSVYQSEFAEYQSYASLAEKAGRPWMNAEYWQGDFDSAYGQFAQAHELEYAQVSFAAYLKAAPKGAGYVWNDLRTFSLPQGQATGKALKEFFDKI